MYKQFAENESFKRFVTDMVFAFTQDWADMNGDRARLSRAVPFHNSHRSGRAEVRAPAEA